MLRTLLAAGTLAVALAAASASAQQPMPPAPQAEVNLVGLPVYSNDGEKLGEVLEVGVMAGQRVLRAEMGTFLGIGPSPVAIPASMYEHKADRIEVSMTAAEVRETLEKQKPK